MKEIKANIYTLKEKVNSSGDYNVLYPTTVCDAVLDLSGKALTEVLNEKQATLVSGTNIKTINGNSLLGSGDVTISGGGGSGDSVASTDYAYGNTQLNGLTINGTDYKLLDVKVNNGSSLIIGKNRSLASGASGAVAIGDCSRSTASGGNSTTIGYGSEVYVPNWVNFDGQTDSLVRTVSLKSTNNIFFRNEGIDSTKKTQASYTSGKTLTQLLNEKQDALVRINIYNISDATTGQNSNFLTFVGFRNVINTGLETMGLNLETLKSNWKTLMAGENATQIWAGLCSLLANGFCFSCFYTMYGDTTLSPIVNFNYLGYIGLNNTTPEWRVIFNDETTLKAAFANSSMMLDD